MKNLILILIGGLALLGIAFLVGWAPRSADPLSEGASGNGDALSKDEVIDLIKQDLAFRKAVGVDEIGLPSVEERTWNDASLGCPQEGESYAQTLTPGYRITLAIGGPASIEQFDYRADTKGNFVLCE